MYPVIWIFWKEAIAHINSVFKCSLIFENADVLLNYLPLSSKLTNSQQKQILCVCLLQLKHLYYNTGEINVHLLQFSELRIL